MLLRERNGGLSRALERGLGLERPPPLPMKEQYGKAVKRWGKNSLDDATLASLKSSMGAAKFKLYMDTINPEPVTGLGLADTIPAPRKQLGSEEQPVQIFESLFPLRNRPTYDTTKKGFARHPLLTPQPVTATSLQDWREMYGELKADADAVKSLEQISYLSTFTPCKLNVQFPARPFKTIFHSDTLTLTLTHLLPNRSIYSHAYSLPQHVRELGNHTLAVSACLEEALYYNTCPEHALRPTG